MLSATTSPHLRDILAIGCLQNINAYKIAGYRSAYMFAVEMELDTPTDLLQQILEWEIDSSKTLSALAIEEFNNAQQPTVVM
jgi:ferritin-like metal-binding protein YciE